MRKILVIIDMQNDFITGALGSEEAQKILPSVLQYAQNFSGEILFTKDTHQPNYLESSIQLAQYLLTENEKEIIDEIQLIGVCTDICVISNAFTLRSFLPETPICVVASCCAGVTPQSHQTALDAMAGCQIDIL